MRTTIIRRIIGITALVMCAIAIVSRIILGDNARLVCQLDNWAMLIAPIFSIAYVIMLTIRIAKGRHWGVKLLEWVGCTILILIFIGAFFIAGVFHDYKIWSNKDYVVYDEFGGFMDPHVNALYKRNGIIDNRLYIIGCWGWSRMQNVDYTIYESLDLLKEEADVSDFPDSEMSHITQFYRLSNGHEYEQSQNDSLVALINQ